MADIHVYDIAANKDAALAVTLPSDFDQMRERWVTKPLDYLTSGHVSPNGDRVVLVSRGHVFVAPVGDGRWVRVSRKDGVRARAARFMRRRQEPAWSSTTRPANGSSTASRPTAWARPNS
ncbi:MAG: hypothetical protein M0C28_35545 [Candidatus Moduliflexus flocculans]|nr:hypothetical protein [Candidatus Moduliflexus flocculans]